MMIYMKDSSYTIINHGVTLKGPVVGIGVFVLIFGLLGFIAKNAWPFSILIIALSIPLIIGKQGLIFNPKTYKYKEFSTIFKWKIWKTWKSYSQFNMVVLIPFSESQFMSSRLVGHNIRSRGYEVFLRNEYGAILKVMEINNYLRAREAFDQLTQNLGLNGIDHYEDVMKKIMKHSKKNF